MFLLVSTLAIFILVLYTVWQLTNLWGWYKTVYGAAPGHPARHHQTPSVALLVPFRNEADNLAGLAASLLAQDYPGTLKLLFIDDHSSDGGADSLPAGVQVLQLADYLQGKPTVAHKKAALTYAISSTTAEIIITTDADCYWPTDRVSGIVREFAGGADVVLGPVLISPAEGFCNAFQALDLAAYQFLTAATAQQGHPALANGANFAFRRGLFEAVGGYAGVDHLPSGDDVLLLHKFYQPSTAYSPVAVREEGQRLPDATKTMSSSRGGQSMDGGVLQRRTTKKRGEPVTRYASGASVSTKPVPGWRALWEQRLRWAGKAGNYNNVWLSFAQGLAFSLSLAILLSLISLPLHLRPRIVLVLWGGKALADLLCLWPVMKHFGQSSTLRWYPLAALLYPFFLVGVGTAALLGFTTKWKGRG